MRFPRLKPWAMLEMQCVQKQNNNFNSLCGKILEFRFQKSIKNKKPEYFYSGFVVPPGIEPGTHGFSVHCSTI